MKIGILFGGRGTRFGEPKWRMNVADVPAWQRMRDELAPLASDDILMVVPPDAPQMAGVHQLQSRGGYLLDVLALLEQMDDYEPMIVVNGDALLITATDIKSLYARSRESGADFVWPVIHRRHLPPERQSWRVTNYLAGTRCGYARGQAMYFRGGSNIQPDKELIERVERRKVYGYFKVMGAVNLLKILTFRLSLADWEERFSALFGGSAKLLPCPIPNLGIDVDTPADLKFAEEMLKARQVG